MIGIGMTDTGKSRSHNEDAFFVSNTEIGPLPNLYIVADGMGGHNGGEIASSRAVEYFCEYCRGYCEDNGEQEQSGILDILIGAASFANQKIYEEALAEPLLSGMGTTLIGLVLCEQKAYIVHVGDSRLYAVTENEIRQLTEDHSFVNEMVKAGKIGKEDARTHPKRNVILRVLGTEEFVQADGLLYDTNGAQAILICSDGLSTMLDDRHIYEIAANREQEGLRGRVERLIAAANEQGGRDNITVILIELVR